MVWFVVDDVLPFHERVIRAGNAAMGLWVRAGAWSSGQLTDGFVPVEVARTLGTAAEIRRLLDVGLWEEAAKESQVGYQFHAWAEDGTGTKRQPTRAEVEAKRRAERERKAAWRERKHTETDTGHAPTVPPSVPPGHHAGLRDTSPRASALPSQSKPIPIEEQEIASAISSPTAAETAPGDALELRDPEPKGMRYPASFEAWWICYPRHEGKRAALPAWQRAVKRADPKRVLDGAIRYRDDPNRDPQFTAHAATWLNRDGWEDAPLPPRRAESAQDRLADASERMFRELGAPITRGA